MHPQLQHDMEQFPLLLEGALRQSLEYLNGLSSHSTHAGNSSTIPDASLPGEPIGAEGALALFNQSYRQLMVGTSGPRYLGFVTGGSTPASIVGDWLTSVYDPNSFSTAGDGDVSALIELQTIRMLLELFGLPGDFVGGFVTGATMSNFTCLAVARQWAGHGSGLDIARDGVQGIIPVLAATPHTSSLKALAMLGMGSRHVVAVKVEEGNRESIDIAHLEKELEALGGKPCILISSGGTVNTVDFDDMRAIAALKQRYNFWWHIDAAFGAFAACSPQYAHLLTGWEAADSITVDCHKWLNVPYDSGVFFVRKEHSQLQAETFQNSNAPYLGDVQSNFSYLNFLPENSRRLRALPAWFTLAAYGKSGYQSLVEESISRAKELGQKVEESKAFRLLAPVRLNTVCFTLTEGSGKEVTTFLSRLTKSGKVFMTPTVYGGTAGIRAAFVNWRTGKEDIDTIWKAMQEALHPEVAA